MPIFAVFVFAAEVKHSQYGQNESLGLGFQACTFLCHQTVQLCNVVAVLLVIRLRFIEVKLTVNFINENKITHCKPCVQP